MKRSVVVVATSDMPAPLRIRAGFVALAVAEYFRDCGKSVLLVVDSVTRLAMAQREIGLAAGEPPEPEGLHAQRLQSAAQNLRARRKFSKRLHHRLLHRAGGRRRFQRAHLRRRARHSRRPHHSLARAGRDGPLSGHRHFEFRQPAGRHASPRRSRARRRARFAKALAAYRQSEDLINLGAYVAGSNGSLDSAIQLRPQLAEFPPPGRRR